MREDECRPPEGTAPDTNHTLTTPNGGEQWANWNGRDWRGIGRGYGGRGIDLTPAEAAAAGLTYKFAHRGTLSVSVVPS